MSSGATQCRVDYGHFHRTDLRDAMLTLRYHLTADMWICREHEKEMKVDTLIVASVESDSLSSGHATSSVTGG